MKSRFRSADGMLSAAEAAPVGDLQRQRTAVAAERAERDSQVPAAPTDMPLPQEAQTIFQGILCVIAVLASLYVAQAVVLPVVLR
jgi:hypothetical protein